MPRHAPKQIGIVAVTAEGAALCYRTICQEGPAFLGEHAHPEVTMHTFSFADYMRSIEAEDWPAGGRQMSDFIMKDLVCGRFEANTRRYFQAAIKSFADDGCQAVVLGCTEIPLLIEQADSVLPILDSTRTLARAALRESTRA